MDSGLNLKALHKQDNKIGAILLSVSQAAIYKFNSSQEQWEKTNAEGSFFICRRSESPIYTFVVLNKLCRENFTEYITSNMEAVLQDYIRAIWFSNNDECIKCEALMSKLICELNSRNMCCNVINTNKPSVSGKSDIVSMLNGAQNKQEMNAISAPSRPIAVTSLMQQAGNMTVSDKADRVPAANGHETRNFAGVKQVQSSNDFLNHLLQSGSNSRKDNFVSISSSAVAVSTTNDIGTVQKAIMSVANPRGYSVVNASDVFAGAVFLQTPISKSEQINAVSSNVPQLMRPDDFLAAGLPASDFQSVETGSTTNFPSSSDLSQLKCAISQLISIDSDFVEELRRKICICSKFHNSGEFN